MEFSVRAHIYSSEKHKQSAGEVGRVLKWASAELSLTRKIVEIAHIKWMDSTLFSVYLLRTFILEVCYDFMGKNKSPHFYGRIVIPLQPPASFLTSPWKEFNPGEFNFSRMLR